MNEPHENLDHDPFADGAQRRPSSRLRRTMARDARRALRGRCVTAKARAAVERRHARPCPHADRGPLR
jgi:hypothetical protein